MDILVLIIHFRKISQWSKDVIKINAKRKTYVENPLASYKLIKRFVKDLEFFTKTYPDLKRRSSIDDSVVLPNEFDLIGAIKGLVRLQKVYNLSSSNLTKGIIDGIDTGIKLSSDEIFIIGEKLSELEGENFLAKEFLQLALSLPINGKYSDISKERVIETLFIFYLKNNQINEAKQTANNLDHQAHKNLIRKHWKSYYSARLAVNPHEEAFKRNGIHSCEKEQLLFRKVCRGDVRKSPKEESTLTCRFHATNAFTKLAPFKVQVANVNPEVLLFIDVVSDNEISTIEELFVKSNSFPARVVDYANEGGKVDNNARVADLFWFSDEYHPVFRRLTQRTEVNIFVIIFKCTRAISN